MQDNTISDLKQKCLEKQEMQNMIEVLNLEMDRYD